jgi:hypothetical protein
MAALRVRSLAPWPAEDARTGREVLVRLGASRGTPLTLGRVQLAALDPAAPIARAEAHLCGPEADPWPLALALLPALSPTSPAPPGALGSIALPGSSAPVGPIAPVLAVRHATDDLCVRFWTP